jgi:hypothetical protein
MDHSITNKIIANIKKSRINTDNFINTENVVSIDSSNIRIGINTKDPQYAIDVSGDSAISWINSKNINISEIAKIQSISGQFAEISDFSSTNIIDISLGRFKLLEGTTIDVSLIIANVISINDISINEINVNTLISHEIIHITEISGNKIDVNEIKCNKIDATNITFPPGQNQDFPKLFGTDLSYTNITADEISSNTLYVNNTSYFNDACFNDVCFNNIHVDACGNFANLVVSNDASFKTVIITDTASIGTLDVIGTASITEISTNNLTIGGNEIFSGAGSAFGGNNIDAKFRDLEINGILKLLSSKLANFSAGFLILPDTLHADVGAISFNASLRQLKFRHELSKSITIEVEKQYAYIKLNPDVSGNDISFNTNSNSYFIDDSHNLIIHDNSSTIYEDSFSNNYKYIPLQKISNKILDVSENKYIELNEELNSDTSIIYEVTANISVQYLNKIPGDVEVTNYTFGMAPYYDSSFNKAQLDKQFFENSFTKITNSITVFDNSYNFATSSINFIGPVNELYIDSEPRKGLMFFISSNKDLDSLRIDNFTCNIKKV